MRTMVEELMNFSKMINMEISNQQEFLEKKVKDLANVTGINQQSIKEFKDLTNARQVTNIMTNYAYSHYPPKNSDRKKIETLNESMIMNEAFLNEHGLKRGNKK